MLHTYVLYALGLLLLLSTPHLPRLPPTLTTAPPPHRPQRFLVENVTSVPWKELKDEDKYTLANEVDWQPIVGRSIVFLQGDFGNVYYMIGAGTVGLYLEKSEDKQMSIAREFGDYRQKEFPGTDEDLSKLGLNIATLPSGIGFGEVAILSDNHKFRSCAAVSMDRYVVCTPMQHRRNLPRSLTLPCTCTCTHTDMLTPLPPLWGMLLLLQGDVAAGGAREHIQQDVAQGALATAADEWSHGTAAEPALVQRVLICHHRHSGLRAESCAQSRWRSRTGMQLVLLVPPPPTARVQSSFRSILECFTDPPKHTLDTLPLMHRRQTGHCSSFTSSPAAA